MTVPSLADLVQRSQRYPRRPGHTREGTSRAAAEDMAPKAGTYRRKALDAITASLNGLTADEVASAVGAPVLTMRPRITELQKLGFVTDSGDERPNRSGKSAIVWVVRNETGRT